MEAQIVAEISHASSCQPASLWGTRPVLPFNPPCPQAGEVALTQAAGSPAYNRAVLRPLWGLGRRSLSQLGGKRCCIGKETEAGNGCHVFWYKLIRVFAERSYPRVAPRLIR